MRSLITGIELVEKADQVEETYNPLTGEYRVIEKSSKPLWPSLTGEPVEKSDGGDTAFTCTVPFIKADKAKQLVYGIVYEPDEVDAQGDEASAEEIEKAAHDFLANSRVLKMMHKGSAIQAAVVESYVTPEDFELGKQEVKKGSWVIVAHISDKKIWKAVVDGKLTGFSMAGYARSDEAA